MPKQKQFFIKHRLPSGEEFEGQFTCRKLSIKQMAAVQVRKATLNGGFYFDENKPGQGVDEDTDWTNHMIAHLEIALIQAPMWFNLDEIYDLDLVLAVYAEVAKFENEFNSPQPRAAISSGSSQTDSGGTGEQSGSAGRTEAVGRGEVPPSLDP